MKGNSVKFLVSAGPGFLCWVADVFKTGQRQVGNDSIVQRETSDTADPGAERGQ